MFALLLILACVVLIASVGRVFADDTPTVVKPIWILVVGMVGEATVTADRSGTGALVFLCLLVGMWGVVEFARGTFRRVLRPTFGKRVEHGEDPTGVNVAGRRDHGARLVLRRSVAQCREWILAHVFFGPLLVGGLTALVFFAVEVLFKHDVGFTAVLAVGVWIMGTTIGCLALRADRKGPANTEAHIGWRGPRR